MPKTAEPELLDREPPVIESHTQEKSIAGIDKLRYESYPEEGMAIKTLKGTEQTIEFLRMRIYEYRRQIRDLEEKADALDVALKDAMEQKTVQDKAKQKQPTIAGRTDYVRKLIRSSGASGVTPKEIRQHAVSDKISIASNFPYTIAAKLRSKGEIREVGGKYYLTLNAPSLLKPTAPKKEDLDSESATE